MNVSYEGYGVELERKSKHTIGFPTFKLFARTQHRLRLIR